jgi:hypothetical protein
MSWPKAVVAGKRRQYVESLATVRLLIIDDFGMRKLPLTAAEDLLEIIRRRYERASALLTSNRPWKTGETARRHSRCRRDARPASSSWPRPEMWSTQLAHQNCRLYSWSCSMIFAYSEPNGGCAPATPNENQNLPLKAKAKASISLPLVGGQGCWSERNGQRILPKLAGLV